MPCVSSYPDYEYKIFKGIKFIYLSGMARFLQENYSCIYSEGSDQNFDEETQGTGESRPGCNRKRLKSADGTRDHQVIDHICVVYLLVVFCRCSMFYENILTSHHNVNRWFWLWRQRPIRWAALMRVIKIAITALHHQKCMLDYLMLKLGLPLATARIMDQKDNAVSTECSLEVTNTLTW